MVTCSHCGKTIDKVVYCSGSCKVQAWRKKHVTKALHVTNRLHPIKTVHDAIQAVQALPTHRGLCKHGHMIGLCNHGCK